METLERIVTVIVGISLAALIPLGILFLFIKLADYKEKIDKQNANTKNKRRKDS